MGLKVIMHSRTYMRTRNNGELTKRESNKRGNSQLWELARKYENTHKTMTASWLKKITTSWTIHVLLFESERKNSMKTAISNVAYHK